MLGERGSLYVDGKKREDSGDTVYKKKHGHKKGDCGAREFVMFKKTQQRPAFTTKGTLSIPKTVEKPPTTQDPSKEVMCQDGRQNS